MNPRTVTTVIDAEKCTGCGACIRVCPSDTITLVRGVAKVTGDRSLACGHCVAVCPQDAVMVKALDEKMLTFDTFTMDRNWLGFGAPPPSDLARLMASRRSCRNFKDRPVPAEVLKDLVKFGALAPSGTNSQAWTFTYLPERSAVLAFGDLLKTFFIRLNKRAENYLLRKGLRMAGMKALDNYYQEYYTSVNEALEQMARHQRDRLFHGACACIIIGSGPDASCPKEDAMLAAGNILLSAHAMGLGSCLIGFAVAAMARDRSIQQALGIPGSERIYAVIALGFPKESYLKTTGRKPAVVRFWTAPGKPANQTQAEIKRQE